MNTLAKDAVSLLIADHGKVKQLFRDFERCDAAHQGLKADIAHQICLELTIHTSIEEEIFYPAVRAQTHDDRMVDAALQEHARAREMIERLRAMQAGDPGLDALVSRLQQAIDHHVREEEGEMLPKARESALNLVGLCEQMRDRKEELEHKLGAVPLRDKASATAQGEQSAAGRAGA